MQTIFFLGILLIFPGCSNQGKHKGLGDADFAPGKGNTTGRKSGFEMVPVIGGDFIMGGSDDVDDGGDPELRIADECPHAVSIKDFFLGKYEVTQADWAEVMGTNPSEFQGCMDCPVERVSWDDIQGFITKLNMLHGETYRLPTEEEWEFAARGGNKTHEYIYAGSNNANDVAWHKGNAGGSPHPVGQLQPNELGLYDMSGNIWEWTSNNKAPYPCDPIGKVFDSKVLRGGSFSHRTSSVRMKDRNGRHSSMHLQTLGFRLAK